jgi:hypothetical protein
MRVHSASTSDSRWLDRNTVVPSRLSCSSRSRPRGCRRGPDRWWLVQHEQPRPAAAAPRPARAAGACPGCRRAPAAGRSRRARPARGLADPPLAAAPRAPGPGRVGQPQVGAPGQVPVEAPAPRRAPPPAGASRRRACRRAARSGPRSADQAEQHPDGRRLAGAVGTEEAVAVALADVQVRAVDGGQPAVPLDQRGRADHRASAAGRHAAARARGSAGPPGRCPRRGTRGRGRRGRPPRSPAAWTPSPCGRRRPGSMRETSPRARTSGSGKHGQPGEAVAVGPDAAAVRQRAARPPRQAGQLLRQQVRREAVGQRGDVPGDPPTVTSAWRGAGSR